MHCERKFWYNVKIYLKSKGSSYECYRSHLALLNEGSLTAYESPYEARAFTTLRDELQFSEPYRNEFMNTVKSYTEEDLTRIQIDRKDVGYIRSLGDMLMRIAYHEAVHSGQLLDYLRTAGVKRPKVWD
ncbi:DinB family protein [Paenibacillus sp. MMO-58]|uniref:DinB family protein n=1 Tax=Paenibacillus sp. MMO-58 TaxID=3081290 RepID=UPI003FA6CE73